jgi:hypothetical protein
MTPSFDASIPVLTEILHAAGNAELDAERKAGPEAELEIEAERAPAAAPVPDRPGHQNLLEQQLSERILQQLEQRITVALEQRMADVLHHALLGLGQEIRDGLRISIGHIVAQELAQLKADIGKE